MALDLPKKRLAHGVWIGSASSADRRTGDNIGMPQTINANLTDYIDEDGRILPANDRTRRLAEFLTQLVARVTIAYGRYDPLGPIHCRHQRCRGLLRVNFSDDGAIGWYCERCADHGSVAHWRRTFFDLLDATWSDPAMLSRSDTEADGNLH